ncbi:uncharacterized protein LOC133350590 isoform X3 [Lethenteron reissneri]|uniref:uncharacterized protein LOC133350590 isoform X3 n=1 Tax=Lethenteron reissneri TaxID=7753 RepID=UPI002AB70FFD|nr:uncharacterized protein LOC133350590 isoform X3 [Lethenteron reissneri]
MDRVPLPITDFPLHHSRMVLQKLNEQRISGLFCDVTVTVSARTFLAHSNVLSACSEYFSSVLTGRSPRQSVALKSIAPDCFSQLLEFFYTAKLPADHIAEFSAAAKQLKVVGILDLGSDSSGYDWDSEVSANGTSEPGANGVKGDGWNTWSHVAVGAEAGSHMPLSPAGRAAHLNPRSVVSDDDYEPLDDVSSGSPASGERGLLDGVSCGSIESLCLTRENGKEKVGLVGCPARGRSGSPVALGCGVEQTGVDVNLPDSPGSLALATALVPLTVTKACRSLRSSSVVSSPPLVKRRGRPRKQLQRTECPVIPRARKAPERFKSTPQAAVPHSPSRQEDCTGIVTGVVPADESPDPLCEASQVPCTPRKRGRPKGSKNKLQHAKIEAEDCSPGIMDSQNEEKPSLLYTSGEFGSKWKRERCEGCKKLSPHCHQVQPGAAPFSCDLCDKEFIYRRPDAARAHEAHGGSAGQAAPRPAVRVLWPGGQALQEPQDLLQRCEEVSMQVLPAGVLTLVRAKETHVDPHGRAALPVSDMWQALPTPQQPEEAHSHGAQGGSESSDRSGARRPQAPQGLHSTGRRGARRRGQPHRRLVRGRGFRLRETGRRLWPARVHGCAAASARHAGRAPDAEHVLSAGLWHAALHQPRRGFGRDRSHPPHRRQSLRAQGQSRRNDPDASSRAAGPVLVARVAGELGRPDAAICPRRSTRGQLPTHRLLVGRPLSPVPRGRLRFSRDHFGQGGNAASPEPAALLQLAFDGRPPGHDEQPPARGAPV